MPYLTLTEGPLIFNPEASTPGPPWFHDLYLPLSTLQHLQKPNNYIQLKFKKISRFQECRISRGIHRWCNSIPFPLPDFSNKQTVTRSLKSFLEAILLVKVPELEPRYGTGFFVKHDVFISRSSKSFGFYNNVFIFVSVKDPLATRNRNCSN